MHEFCSRQLGSICGASGWQPIFCGQRFQKTRGLNHPARRAEPIQCFRQRHTCLFSIMACQLNHSFAGSPARESFSALAAVTIADCQAHQSETRGSVCSVGCVLSGTVERNLRRQLGSRHHRLPDPVRFGCGSIGFGTRLGLAVGLRRPYRASPMPESPWSACSTSAYPGF